MNNAQVLNSCRVAIGYWEANALFKDYVAITVRYDQYITIIARAVESIGTY